MELNIWLRGLLCLLYFGLIIVMLRQRQSKAPGYRFLVAVAVLLWLVNLERLFQGLGWLSFLRATTRESIPLYLAFLSAVLLYLASRAFLGLAPSTLGLAPRSLGAAQNNNAAVDPHIPISLTARGIQVVKGWYWLALPLAWLAGTILVTENIHNILIDRAVIGPLAIDRSAAGLALVQVGWVAAIVASLVVTVMAYRGTVHPLHQNRDIFWFIGLVLGLVGVILVMGAPVNSPTPGILGPAGDLVVCLSIAWLCLTFFTHDLPDLRRSLRSSLSVVISVLFSILIYGLFFFFTLLFLRNYDRSTNGVVVAVVLAAVITLLLHPITRSIQRFVSKMVLESGYDPGQLISDYSKKIANIIDLNSLASTITTTISAGFNLRQARLFLIEPLDNGYRLVEVIPAGGETSQGIAALPLELTLPADSPVTAYLRFDRQPLPQYDIDLLPRFRKAAEIPALKGLAIDLYVSIFSRDRWIGLLGLGAKLSGERFFDKELSMLETLADQTAVALENARLYQDLKNRNADNERLNQELVSANLELSNLDKAKSDFINIASHELRTPLTQVLGYDDILEEMFSGGSLSIEEGQPMLEGIRKAARRLEETVNMMFDVSRLDLSALELSKSRISLTTILTAVVEAWQAAVTTRGMALTVQDLSELPLIEADGQRLVQAFSHLLQNAIKFTPDGGKIGISGQYLESDRGHRGQFIEVVVSDSGIGIATEDLERIFDKFYRVGDALLHSSGDFKFMGAGPGLGLTLCRGIVAAHGGRVWAESPGCDEVALPGSKFHVILPLSSPLPPLV